nr:uncharacterized protein LOC116152184 [Camelus dromedarius]
MSAPDSCTAGIVVSAGCGHVTVNPMGNHACSAKLTFKGRRQETPSQRHLKYESVLGSTSSPSPSRGPCPHGLACLWKPFTDGPVLPPGCLSELEGGTSILQGKSRNRGGDYRHQLPHLPGAQGEAGNLTKSPLNDPGSPCPGTIPIRPQGRNEPAAGKTSPPTGTTLLTCRPPRLALGPEPVLISLPNTQPWALGLLRAPDLPLH